ncbi:MAG TPA: NAD(P)/FAD-dependent oxidoreductase [Chloroflexia bacterium]|nr:NAD(P)/FAD-dependent oxidoreductase [Chloroflexia bacterium]
MDIANNGVGAASAGGPAAPAPGAEDIYDITIIGAGPTGLFGAFYAGMRELRTKIIDALPEPGGQLIALYPEKLIFDAPGFPEIYAKDLVTQLVAQALRWNPTMVLGERVLQLTHRADGLIVLGTDKGSHLTRTVVIAAGVGAFEPTRLKAPGVDQLEGQGVHYFVKQKAVFRDKNLLIVGGGDSAVDWALNLQDTARHITLIHRRNEFRAHESSVNQMHASPPEKLEVLTPWEVRAIAGGAQGIEHVTLFNNATQAERTLAVDAVLLNLGFKADIGPIKEWGLQLDKRMIRINERTETNLPGVFAAGDIAAETVKMNLIATCYGQAALAVNVAKNYIDPRSSIFPGHSSEKMGH